MTSTIGRNQPCMKNPLWSTALGNQCDVMYRGTGSLLDLKYHDFVKKLEALQDSCAILDCDKWSKLYVKSKRNHQGVNKRSMIRLYTPTAAVATGLDYDTCTTDEKTWRMAFYWFVFRNYVDGPLAFDYVHAYHNKAFCYPWKLTDCGKNQACHYLRNRARIGKIAERTELIPLDYTYNSQASGGHADNTRVRWVDFLYDYSNRWPSTKEFWYKAYLEQVLLREIARKVIAPNIAAYAPIESIYNNIHNLLNEFDQNPFTSDKRLSFDKYTFSDDEKHFNQNGFPNLKHVAPECISQDPNNAAIQQETLPIKGNYYKSCKEHDEDMKTSTETLLEAVKNDGTTPYVPYAEILDALTFPHSSHSKTILKKMKDKVSIKNFIVNTSDEKLETFYSFCAYRRFLLEIFSQINAAEAMHDKNNTSLLQTATIKTEDVLSFSTYATLRKMLKSEEAIKPTIHPAIGVNNRSLDHIIGLYCETTTKCQSNSSSSRKKGSYPLLDVVVTKIALPDTTSSSQMQSIKSFSDIVKPLNKQNQVFMIDVTRFTNGLSFYRHAPGPVFSSKLLQHIEECSTFNGENLMRSEILSFGHNNNKANSSIPPIGLHFAPRHSVYTVLTNDGKIVWILDRKEGKVALIAPQWKLSNERSRTATGVKPFYHNDADIFFSIRNGLMPPPISFSNIQHNFREEYLSICKSQIAKDTNDTGLLYKVMLDSNKPVYFTVDSKTGKTYMDQTMNSGRISFDDHP